MLISRGQRSTQYTHSVRGPQVYGRMHVGGWRNHRDHRGNSVGGVVELIKGRQGGGRASFNTETQAPLSRCFPVQTGLHVPVLVCSSLRAGGGPDSQLIRQTVGSEGLQEQGA